MNDLFVFSSRDVEFKDEDWGTLLDAYKRQSALLCVQLYSGVTAFVASLQ